MQFGQNYSQVYIYIYDIAKIMIPKSLVMVHDIIKGIILFQIETNKSKRQTIYCTKNSLASSSASTSSFSILSSTVEKEWPSCVDLTPKDLENDSANGEKATQSYPSNISLKKNVPYDAATFQGTGK